MALTGDQIEAITARAVALYADAEAAILARLTSTLAAGLDSPDWAVQRLAAVRRLRRAIEQTLQLAHADGADAIRTALAQAYRSGRGIATTGLPAHLLPRDPDTVGAAAAARIVPRVAAMESLAAALVDDVGRVQSNVLRHVIDVFREVIQRATGLSIAGGMTRRDAAQAAYAKLVDQGVASFTDSAGRQWRLSSYTEMATRTVTQRAAVQGQTDRLTSLGVDTVRVSDSPRECPLCRPWEGKILSISGDLRGTVELESSVGPGTVTVDIAGSVEEARAAGLQHPNCTHALRAFLPGATKLKEPTADPAGYVAKQRQREIERHIRRWKEREASALDPAAKASAARKVREWQGAMRQHLADNDLKRLPYREQIGGGNVPKPGSVASTALARPLAGGKGARLQAADLDLTPATPATPTLADRVAGGERNRERLGGGVMADTSKVRLNDGTDVVYKLAKDSSGRDAIEQQDAEELGARVARAVGLQAPDVHRISPTEIYMSYLDGETFDELDDAAQERLRRSDEGRRLGLADLLMGNTDRNSGNLIVMPDGRIGAIDHGGALDWHQEYNPGSRPPQLRAVWWSDFGSHEGWADANPLSPTDVRLLEERLTALRSEFERLNRPDWWTAMMERLSALAAHATGRGILE